MKLNLGGLGNSAQAAELINRINEAVKSLGNGKLTTNNTASTAAPSTAQASTQQVSAQQVIDPDFGLSISLTTPLGTISFSFDLDLPEVDLTEILNILLSVIEAVLCALFPTLDICTP
ncbi:hypothetical protein GFC29_2298 [Anoxybacillus sp. B7M1]|jgi:hypothetical protein|uniref:Uncharacterized protein n=1 Tax=Anoxybacteroides rupiense TaxID=311460 RepID=A0ABD5IWT5_9BACL|nr:MULTISPECIES: hypothetical protein [Anoxybacillus]ANB57086.1 hypothetical protein GFC28_3136 [Anoxybacillus sp. B2M1]ANB64790.1 hypothetical protein GFC29_2298 [Anoxybacillus sp. B7M1]KXG09588.1 hypothetical protein AT864_02058 [Anoxybacillus sp. P3H1B]MDE8564955.1 hypothetical protein [Anoxybacillus rupiensis]MED5052442.1 hypothetical protein [Anoxybacillus rupiensis]